jgi:hypothetical protein
LLPLCNRETLVYDLRNVPGTFAQIIEVRIISKKAECVRSKALKAVPEPKNVVDKYAVCVMLGDEIVGHLKKGRTGCFAKTVFYFLRADEKGSCTAIVKGKAVNLGDGEGMQVPCTLHFKGTTKFIDVLRQQLQKNN